MTQHMAEWWCPKPWTTEIVAMEPRAGGRSATIMRGSNGEEGAHEGIFLAWDEGRRFAFTDAVTAELMPSGPFMIGIMELTPEGLGTR